MDQASEHDAEAEGNPLSSLPVNWSGRITLLMAIAVILVVWLQVLPRIAELDSVSRQMEFLESRGIDPSARYYTDQPAGWKNADLMEAKLKQSPEAFWSLTPDTKVSSP